MKNYCFLGLIALFLLPGCNTPQPETIVVKETAVVEMPVTVEVTREVEVTRLVTVIPEPTPTAVPEYPVTTIALAGPIADRRAEISGLAWYEDWLIMLPQYPDFAGGAGDGFLYALPKADILAFLNGEVEALKALEIPLIAPGLAESIAGYEGFEAVAFDGQRAYLTIEASPREGMRGYLVAGEMAADLSQLAVDTAVLTEILPQNDIGNKSEEALFIAGDQIVTLYETYGAAVTESPVAHRFEADLTAVDAISFPHIDYRVTDATALDGDGRFWAINYFFPGDNELAVETEPLAAEYGRGATHQQYDYVERLVQFQYSEDGITLTDAPPIQLELIALDARNWEGVVRLDDIGFLLATDKFPTTLLGFVALDQ